MFNRKLLALIIVTSLLFTGCKGDDDDDEGSSSDHFTLQLLHFADIDGNDEIALNALENFSALVNGFKNDATYGANSLFVSSGDNIIPGPRYYSVDDSAVQAIHGSDEPGSADMYLLNELGVQASAVGNHELDAGPDEFDDSINKDDFSTTFPYLASNIDFSPVFSSDLIGTDGSDVSSLGGQVAKYATVTVNGETIGLVGVSTPSLPNITSPGDLVIYPEKPSTWTAQDLADVVQPSIDALTTLGVNKIIVLAHLQDISYEKALAPLLSDVDIIVAGGSNTRMGDSNDTLYPGDTEFAESYPYETKDANGNPLLIVNVDADYKYLGRLVVGFNSSGVINLNSLKDTLNGAWASTSENVTTAGGTAISNVMTMRSAMQNYMNELYGNVIGSTSVYLDGRRESVRSEETNLGNLTADANLWYANLYATANSQDYVQIAIKNGGGIRTEIGQAVVNGETYDYLPPQANTTLGTTEGDISEGHVKSALKFNNGLVVIDVTAAELKVILEETVAYLEEGSTSGSFPQVAGMKIAYDLTQTAQGGSDSGVTTAGARIREVVVDSNGDGTYDETVVTGGSVTGSGTYRIVTLNYLALDGGYGYELAGDYANSYQLYPAIDPVTNEATSDWSNTFTTSGDPSGDNEISTEGYEQDAFVEYILEFHPDSAHAYNIAETDPADDTRVQNLAVRIWVP